MDEKLAECRVTCSISKQNKQLFIKVVLKYSIQYIQSLFYAEHKPTENHLILLAPHICYDFWKLLTVVFFYYYYLVSYVLTNTNFCFNYLHRRRSGFARLTPIKNKNLCTGSDPHLDTNTCLMSFVLLLSYQIQRSNTFTNVSGIKHLHYCECLLHYTEKTTKYLKQNKIQVAKKSATLMQVRV